MNVVGMHDHPTIAEIDLQFALQYVNQLGECVLVTFEDISRLAGVCPAVIPGLERESLALR